MPYVASDPTESLRPTRVRYGVLAFAATLSMITYLDRVCISSGQSHFIHDLGLQSEADLKWVFALFTLAYSLFEVPSGWLGDVIGPRKVLIRIVLWWSCFTAITGFIGMRINGILLGVSVLAVVQFLFGMGEAGAYPNITRALHNWFPFQERGLAQGTVWMSARLMGGLTPLIWLLLVEGVARDVTTSGEVLTWYLPPLLHWRATFWFFGTLGVAWCVLFFIWFRDRPEQKSSVNAAELALIRARAAEAEAGHARVPWMKLISSGNLWALCIMYFCQAYGWYFYITYLPRFLEKQYGVTSADPWGAIYKGGPLWMGAIGCLVGGFLTDWLVRKIGRRLGRKSIGAVGHGMCMVCFLFCPFMPTAFTFFLAISFAGFSADLTMGASWATCQDIGRRYAAIVASFMNMIGNLGGFVATLIGGSVLKYGISVHAAKLGTTSDLLTGADLNAGLRIGYQINFFVFAAVYVIGVICWLRINADKPVADE
jgi:MFS transporter, ACS family, glucarate transporter